MAQYHRTAVQRFFEEAYNAGNIRILPELIAPEHISHLPTGDHYGPEGVRIDIAGFRAAFPDLTLMLDDVLDSAEEDTIVYRFTARGTHKGPFMGVPPTGRRVRVVGIGIDRFRDGKMIERWVQYDSAGLLQQLGALPGFCACAD
ncbi:MAG TPA: ester cyclase [Thermomicrobiales bacterium]|nr:ester cyclase [Thermomicrobiales bacterium]